MAQLLSTMAQLPLTDGCIVRWEAIDPATGAAVADVIIDNAVLYGDIFGDVSIVADGREIPPVLFAYLPDE